MDEAMLLTIKKMLGLSDEDSSFDTDILIHMNGTLSIIHQLGVTIPDDMVIEDTTTWEECFGDDLEFRILNTLRNYMYLKVRKGFDPPQNSTAMESMDSLIKEYEWRLNVSVDPKEITE